MDSSGNEYIAAVNAHAIYKVTSSGAVSILAGGSGSGFADGTGSAAKFNLSNFPAVALDSAGGFLYVADQGNCVIRKVAISSGAVTTPYGTNGTCAIADGTGNAATFKDPRGLALDSTAGILYELDHDALRTITLSSGAVATVAMGGTSVTNAGFGPRAGMATDGHGHVFIPRANRCDVEEVDGSTGSVLANYGLAGTCAYADGTTTAAEFNRPHGVAVDSTGTNLYVSDKQNCVIRKVVISTGVVSTLAGSTGTGCGFADGTGAAAKFWLPQSMAADASGNIYASEMSGVVRKITSAGVVTTQPGLQPIGEPLGGAADSSGNVYLADNTENVVWKISSSGTASILAGSPGQSGSTDGTGQAARFGTQACADCGSVGPIGLALDSAAGAVYVADTGNCIIRKVTTAGGVVSTVAGNSTCTEVDGTGTAAQFNNPWGLALDATNGMLYITDKSGCRVRRMSTTTFAEVPVPSAKGPPRSSINRMGSLWIRAEQRYTWPTSKTTRSARWHVQEAAPRPEPILGS